MYDVFVREFVFFLPFFMLKTLSSSSRSSIREMCKSLLMERESLGGRITTSSTATRLPFLFETHSMVKKKYTTKCKYVSAVQISQCLKPYFALVHFLLNVYMYTHTHTHTHTHLIMNIHSDTTFPYN